MPKSCIFCKTELTKANRAKEHIVPQWLQRHLTIVGDGIVEVQTTGNGQNLEERRHTLLSLVAGNCCETCNGGWMSQLEGDVMAPLKDLLAWNRTLDQLNNEEKAVLSIWIIKTVYALFSAGPYWHRIPQKHIEHLYSEHRPHPNVFVYGTHIQTNRTYAVRGSYAWDIFGTLTDNQRQDVEQHSYKIVLQFENLVLMVAFWPVDTWFVTVKPDRYFVLSGDLTRLKFLAPQFTQSSTMTFWDGIKAFADEVYALQDDVPEGKTVILRKQGTEFRWTVTPAPIAFVFRNPGQTDPTS